MSVFLTPPSLKILEERLHKRGADAATVMRKRLAVARQEIAQWKNFDYLLISSTKEEDLRQMLAIVEAEKMRTTRSHPVKFKGRGSGSPIARPTRAVNKHGWRESGGSHMECAGRSRFARGTGAFWNLRD